jgi:FdrA protein
VSVIRGMVGRGLYLDSIVMMQVADELRRLPGVVSVAMLMATDANRTALRESAMWPAEAEGAGPSDVVLALRADGEAAAVAALARATVLVTARGRRDETAAAVQPRSVLSAAREAMDPNLAVIAVPGRYATIDAQQALSAGLHVFLFSDDVPLADEIALKRRGRERGLLVMGPECGTSIIDGVGLGFANRVRRGGVGLVGASGTGLQEVTCLIHRMGAGVSHAIGTGGRDLHEEVGGLTTLQALDRLAADPTTAVIVVVSKPGSQRVADLVLAAAAATGKPIMACLLGFPGTAPSGVRAMATLEAAATAAVEALGGRPAPLERPRLQDADERREVSARVFGHATRARRDGAGEVRGLFTGGTLCEEARAIVGEVPKRFIDFGAPEYTRGRPHPMIAPDLRNAALSEAGNDPAVAVVLLDFVLGLATHRDPVAAAAGAIEEARGRAEQAGRPLAIVAHVVGTDDDPQPLAEQESALRALGVVVCPSNRLAAEVARELARGPDAS